MKVPMRILEVAEGDFHLKRYHQSVLAVSFANGMPEGSIAKYPNETVVN